MTELELDAKIAMIIKTSVEEWFRTRPSLKAVLTTSLPLITSTTLERVSVHPAYAPLRAAIKEEDSAADAVSGLITLAGTIIPMLVATL